MFCGLDFDGYKIHKHSRHCGTQMGPGFPPLSTWVVYVLMDTLSITKGSQGA